MGIGEIIALVVIVGILVGVILLLVYVFLPDSWGDAVMAFTIGLVIVVAVVFMLAFLAQWLWNMLMPSIFNLPMLSYWETFGLMILGRLLTGGGTSS